MVESDFSSQNGLHHVVDETLNVSAACVPLASPLRLTLAAANLKSLVAALLALVSRSLTGESAVVTVGISKVLSREALQIWHVQSLQTMYQRDSLDAPQHMHVLRRGACFSKNSLGKLTRQPVGNDLGALVRFRIATLNIAQTNSLWRR